MAVYRAENLKKSFRRRLVVKGVDLEARAGEIVALLGRNGAGKTTIFQMMVGLIKPDDGAIFLDETDISRLTTPQRASLGITYLPQENSVFLKATVEENLLMILELHGFSDKEKRSRADELLKELGLTELSSQSAHSLSGGERRRLEIGRSLVIEPKFLLLDEPFTGIDPLTIVELQKILSRLRRRDIGIILSDHNVRDTFRVADRAYVINEGEILVEGPPRTVAEDPGAKEYFLGKNFRWGQEIDRYSL